MCRHNARGFQEIADSGQLSSEPHPTRAECNNSQIHSPRLSPQWRVSICEIWGAFRPEGMLLLSSYSIITTNYTPMSISLLIFEFLDLEISFDDSSETLHEMWVSYG